MLGRDSADTILAATAYDQSGDKIGSVGRLYLDDNTGEPAWASVRTGLFGTKENFVPLQGASLDGDRLIVTVTQDAVKHAPQVDLEDEHLGLEQSQELYRYYGIAEPAGHGSDTDDTDDADGTDTDGPDRSARPEALGAGSGRGALDPSPGDSGSSDPPPPLPAMTPQTGDSDVRESGTPGLRLRRHVVHEEQTITVPVVREEYVLEGEPEDDDTGRSPDPGSGPAPTPPPRGV